MVVSLFPPTGPGRFLRTVSLLCFAFFCLGAGTLTNATGQVSLGPRFALLIGNADYPEYRLPGVKESLDEVEQSLQPLGFHIVRKQNLSGQELKTVVAEFARQVPTNGVALFYFAGLGSHLERLGRWHNLLRPVGESIENENDYRSRALDVLDLLKALNEESGSRVNLVFLDACWESPIKPDRGEIANGLRACDVPVGSLVMFAGASGQALPPATADKASRLGWAWAL